MNTQTAGSNEMVASVVTRHEVVRKVLLFCGILSSLFYVISNDVIAATRIPGYSRISDPISELSATYSPARPTLVPLIILYEFLLITFGIGVWQSAQEKRLLRVTSVFIIAFGVLGLASYPFPMTQRNLSDMMHIITMGILTPLLIFLTIGFGASPLGKWFLIYSILTLIVFGIGGAFIGMETAKVAAGEPVYWYGLAERILFGAWLLWIAVLSVMLLRAHPEQNKM
jgi:hypothetical protein